MTSRCVHCAKKLFFFRLAGVNDGVFFSGGWSPHMDYPGGPSCVWLRVPVVDFGIKRIWNSFVFDRDRVVFYINFYAGRYFRASRGEFGCPRCAFIGMNEYGCSR